MTEMPPTFIDVYETTFSAVWAYCGTQGVRGSDLEDVVQEVFVVVHRRLSTFEGRSIVKTWVIGIAFNVIRQYRRRRATRNLGERLDELPEPVDRRSLVSRRLEAQSDARFLAEIIERMTDDQREIFVLIELEELTAVEAAALLGVNKDTLRSRLRSARQIVNRAVATRKAALSKR